MSERRRTIIVPSADINVPGTNPVARGLDGSTIRRFVARKHDSTEPNLGLLEVPVASTARDNNAVEDALDLFPSGVVVYERPRTPKLSSEQGGLWKGILTRGQYLIPVADSEGTIRIHTDRGTLVHYIGIEEMIVKGKQITSGWVLDENRIKPGKYSLVR